MCISCLRFARESCLATYDASRAHKKWRCSAYQSSLDSARGLPHTCPIGATDVALLACSVGEMMMGWGADGGGGLRGGEALRVWPHVTCPQHASRPHISTHTAQADTYTFVVLQCVVRLGGTCSPPPSHLRPRPTRPNNVIPPPPTCVWYPRPRGPHSLPYPTPNPCGTCRASVLSGAPYTPTQGLEPHTSPATADAARTRI